MKTVKFESWAKTECELCEFEFQVTRTEAREIEGPIICSGCQNHNDGIDYGKKLMLDEIEACESMGEISKLLRQFGR